MKSIKKTYKIKKNDLNFDSVSIKEALMNGYCMNLNNCCEPGEKCYCIEETEKRDKELLETLHEL